MIYNYSDKINWFWLSRNPNDIELLIENSDKIRWRLLSSNPGIFRLNTKEIINLLLIENPVFETSDAGTESLVSASEDSLKN